MNYRCPVCIFKSLPYPPADYHICPCCGTEFGNDDENYSHEQLREMWIATGAHWFFGRPPIGWNPWHQLIEGGVLRIAIQLGTTKTESLKFENLNLSDALVPQVGTGAHATAH